MKITVIISLNREEKSLCHVAMAANFGLTTNRKFTQKVNSQCFKLHRSYSISFNLLNVGKIFWILSERTAPEF